MPIQLCPHLARLFGAPGKREPVCAVVSIGPASTAGGNKDKLDRDLASGIHGRWRRKASETAPNHQVHKTSHGAA